MTKNEIIANGIKSVVSSLMERVMENVLHKDPFVPENHRAAKPIYAALVPDEIFKGAHFERRFVTPFGGVWEKLATVVAREQHGECGQNVNIDGLIPKTRLQRIHSVLNRLEHKNPVTKQRITPNWENELEYIMEGKGELVPCSVVCDLLVKNTEYGKTYAFELKGPLPNNDQTKVSKEKMFKLFTMQPQKVDFTYFALPYNPYIVKTEYAWSFPMRWFDMKNDPCVLIGDEFWDFIGGDGTYRTFINEINSLGDEYRSRIYREFLGIEPLENTLRQVLR